MEAVGDGVSGIAVGDRVAVDPSLYCGDCHYCRIGRGNQCERWRAIGVTEPGAAAEFVVAPGANCVRLPDFVETADAALIEPLSCAVRGFDVLQPSLGDHFLIYGAGTMGLMMMELAKRAGAATVSMVDLNAERLLDLRPGLASYARGSYDLELRGYDAGAADLNCDQPSRCSGDGGR